MPTNNPVINQLALLNIIEANIKTGITQFKTLIVIFIFLSLIKIEIIDNTKETIVVKNEIRANRLDTICPFIIIEKKAI